MIPTLTRLLRPAALRAGLFLAATLAFASLASAQSIVDLGTLGGSYSYPYLINNTGMVVGNSALPLGDTTFIWSEATGMVALPAIGVGGNPASFLSDAGLVGGYYTPGTPDANGNLARQAFLWSASAGYRFIGTLGGSYSSVQFVNSAGTVVGYSTLAGDMITRTFVWTAATGMTDIGSFGGGATYAEAINASGQIIGESDTADGNQLPFFWDAAHGLQPIVTGLDSAQPFLLSDSGVVWGNGYPPAGGLRFIFAWSAASGLRTFDVSSFIVPGPMGGSPIFQFRGLTPSGKAIIGAFVMMGGNYGFVIDPVAGPQLIVPPGSTADGSSVQLNAVSKGGYAVGSYQRTDIGSSHAFIWDEVNGARDLGTLPGGSFSAASAVNNRGEVTGVADTATGEQHAFLWTAASGMQDLGTVGGTYSYGNLIGDSGLTGSSTVAGDQNSHAFFVKLRNAGVPVDTQPPVLTLPANITVNATSTSGAVVIFTATATDNVDGSVSVTLSKASGSVFAFGTTTVTATAHDAAGNTATGSFTVTVVNGGPALTLPANLTAEATGPNGANVSFTASALDVITGKSRPVKYSKEPGSKFPLGTTTVTVTSTDKAGKTSTGTFTVTVRDTTPPKLTLPKNITACATTATGAKVNFTVDADDLVDQHVAVTYSQAPGSVFPVGTTTVVVRATDASGNSTSGSLTVTVTKAQKDKDDDKNTGKGDK